MSLKGSSVVNEEMANEALDRIANGEGLRGVAKGFGVSFGKLSQYLNAHYYERYTKARQTRAELRFDKIDEYGNMLLDGELRADAARVLIDKEKWQAGKENHGLYGDKSHLHVEGNLDISQLTALLDESTPGS